MLTCGLYRPVWRPHKGMDNHIQSKSRHYNNVEQRLQDGIIYVRATVGLASR